MKMNMNKLALVVALATAALLTACGGGGSSAGSSTPPVATPAPTPAVPGNLLQTEQPTTYAAGSTNATNWSDLSRIRIAGGFGAPIFDPVMYQAAAAHDAYMWANQAGGAGLTPHNETAGLSGFTGVDPQARCVAAALGTSSEGKMACGEVRSSANVSAANFHLMNIFTLATGHLQEILDWRNNYVGMHLGDWPDATPSFPDAGGSVELGTHTDNLAKLDSDKANSIVGVFPYDGMQDVLVGVSGGGTGGTPAWCQCTSILVQTSVLGLNPMVTTFTLRKDGATSDTPVEIVTGGAMHGTEPTLVGWGIMFPTVVLDVNSKYNVTFKGYINNVAIEKSWSFTTGTRTSY